MGRWRVSLSSSLLFSHAQAFPSFTVHTFGPRSSLTFLGVTTPGAALVLEQTIGAVFWSSFYKNKDRTSTVPAFFSVGVSCAVLVVWSRPVPARADRGSCGPARRAARDATAATGPSRSRHFWPRSPGSPLSGRGPSRAWRRLSRVDSTLWRWPGWCFDCGRSGSSSWAY